MEAPCCVGVVRDSEGLVGKEFTAGKALKVYYVPPKVKNWTRMGIIVVHDIFGYTLPNCKYIVDHFAAQGYDAVLPDFYKNQEVEPWPATEKDISKPLDGEEFSTWFGKITTKEFWEKFNAEVAEAIAFLRKKNKTCTRFGIIGFCWGGLAAEVAAKGGKLDAAVSVHGCAHTAESFKEVTGSMLYITVPEDPFFSKASQEEITAAGGKVQIVEGMSHGFAVRGDFSDGKVKAAADKVCADAEGLFRDACLQKPKFITVDKIDPQARNVNTVLKMVGEAAEVEGSGSSKFFEITCGDSTGRLVLSLTNEQKVGLSDGKVLTVRNAHVKMVKGYMKLKVDKWGKLEKDVGEVSGAVGEKNLSATEYELVGNES